LDCVLEPTKASVLASLPKIDAMKVKNREPALGRHRGENAVVSKSALATALRQ